MLIGIAAVGLEKSSTGKGVKYLFGQENHILPWHCSEDLEFFKEKIRNKTCLVGYSTYVNLPKSVKAIANFKELPRHITFSSSEEYFNFYASLEEEIYIIGGKKTFKLAFPAIERFFLTRINQELFRPLTGKPIYFPELVENLTGFSKKVILKGDKFTIVDFKRKKLKNLNL